MHIPLIIKHGDSSLYPGTQLFPAENQTNVK